MADSPFLLFYIFSFALILFFSVYLSISLTCWGHHPSLLSPHPSSGLIVLHLFIQSFMAASSSCRPISLPADGFLLQLLQLFIINVGPHHISLTLGRWFSHWTALLTQHITNPVRSTHKHACAHTQCIHWLSVS